MSTNRWIWSPPHNDYYMVTYNNLGQPIYEWGREYLHRTHSTPNPSASLGNVTSGTAEPEAAEHDLGWSAFDNRFDELWGRNMSRHLDGRSNAALRSTIVGPLDQDYEVILNPKGFFKKGRVFMVPWPEPGGESLRDQLGPPIFLKIRRFVVIRPRTTFCLCLPIQTYQGQATTKPGLSAHDHAAVVEEGHLVQLHEGEEILTKQQISIKIENPNISGVDPMSRVNFAKVYTVEYNVKVCNIGRLTPESIYRMEQYFAECFRLDAN